MPYNSYRIDLMGSAKLEPCRTVEVDSYQTFKLTYTAGKFGIDDQGGLKIGFVAILMDRPFSLRIRKHRGTPL